MFSGLEHILLSTIHSLSLEVFVFLASFIEEVIAPIPSPTVMVVTGSFALLQERSLYALIPLSLIGALGKTLGALVVYFITFKAEHVVMHKFGRFFNVTQVDVDRFGSRIGKGKRDYFMLIALRAIPFVPSVIVSVGSGLLKVSLPLFIVSTFVGTIVRDGIYLYAGFVGTVAVTRFVNQSTHLETYIEVIVVAIVAIFVLKKCFFIQKFEKKD